MFDARTPLASLALHSLSIRCPACGTREVPFADLIARMGRGAELGRVLPKLRCQACGAAPDRLVAVNDFMRECGREPDRVDLTGIAAEARKAA